jgi:predicted GNAT superfamily acetyltransferase
MTDETPIEIRTLGTIDEYYACEEIQRLAWSAGDDEVVPAHMLLAISQKGGLLLGAFEAQSQPNGLGLRLVGFVMGLLALREPLRPGSSPTDVLCHYSHMLGVHPDWWGQGIGYRLKLAQREAALAQGLTLITWTFDPLERRNASLNFAKLGTVCRTYIANLYGELRDMLNKGLPSDRFQVDWWLRSQRVKRRITGERPDFDMMARDIPVINPATPGANNLLHPSEAAVTLEGGRLLVEVPADFQALKQADLSLARAWRDKTRAIFQTAFAQGYSATEYLRQAERSYYLIAREAVA